MRFVRRNHIESDDVLRLRRTPLLVSFLVGLVRIGTQNVLMLKTIVQTCNMTALQATTELLLTIFIMSYWVAKFNYHIFV
jgi:hypothetical protein